MTSAQFLNRGRPATGDDFAELEQLLGFPLPSAYRSFLADANGGRLNPGGIVLADGRRFGVREFFALGDDDAAFTPLSRAIAVYRNRVPQGFVPIGDDPAGNLWCVRGTGDGVGSVWFWQHEFDVDEGEQPTLDNMLEIAGDFDGFVSRIT